MRKTLTCPYGQCQHEFEPSDVDHDCGADESDEIVCPKCGRDLVLSQFVMVRWTVKRPTKKHQTLIDARRNGGAR